MSASQSASDSRKPSQALPIAQRAQSKNLVNALQQALKAMPLYGENNQATTRVVETLRDCFRSVWTHRSTITLQFTPDSISIDEFQVSRVNAEFAARSDNLADAFYQDGIRSLTFRQGFELEEMRRFLALAAKARAQQEKHEDLVVLLWHEDFDCLAYELVEPVRHDDPPAPRLAEAILTSAGPAGDGAPDDPPPLPEALLSQSLTVRDLQLGTAEAVYLEELLQEELRRDVRKDVISAMLDSLQDGEEAIQLEIIGLLEALVPELLRAGKLQATANLLDELRTLSEATQDVGQVGCKALQRFLGRVETSAAIAEFIRELESGEIVPELQELSQFVSCLGPTNTLALVRASELIKNKKIAAVVRQASEKTVARHPDVLLDLLRSDDPAVVCSATRMVSAAHGEEAQREIIRLLKHRQPRMRLAATKSLVCVGSPQSLQALLTALADDDEEVRQASAWALATWAYRPALDPLRAVLEGPRLPKMLLNEKIAYFDAYARIGGTDAVGFLAEILNKRHLFRPRYASEMRACAARGLGQVKAPSARQALKRAAYDADAKVRRVVQRQLREVQAR